MTAVDLDVAGVRCFKYLENKKLKYKLFYIIIRIKWNKIKYDQYKEYYIIFLLRAVRFLFYDYCQLSFKSVIEFLLAYK